MKSSQHFVAQNVSDCYTSLTFAQLSDFILVIYARHVLQFAVPDFLCKQSSSIEKCG